MSGSPVEPRLAATVVLLRPGAGGPEVLLTHRPASMAFAGDMHVFPGGRVDAADADPALLARSAIDPATAAERLGGDLDPTAALAAYVAAIREVFEEVGVLLADHAPGVDLIGARARLLAAPDAFPAIATELDLRLWTDRLVALSRWVTPASLERRFDARFFVATMPPDVESSLVGDEVAAQAWHRPADALDAMGAGRIGMWLPTSTTLMQLEHVRGIDDVAAHLAPRAHGKIVVEPVSDAVVRIEMPAGGGIAGQPVNAYLVGRSSFVLVDPGDPTGPGLDRAIEIARDRGGHIVAVALTHPDPDHAAGAEALAEDLGVPIHVGAGRERWLPYEPRVVRDGDRVTLGDVPLAVVATPGPTADHVAYVLADGAIAISGDLDGPRGARSLPGPVDEPTRRRSVERLQRAAPDARWLAGHPG